MGPTQPLIQLAARVWPLTSTNPRLRISPMPVRLDSNIVCVLPQAPHREDVRMVKGLDPLMGTRQTTVVVATW